jgi:hypothetical protein
MAFEVPLKLPSEKAKSRGSRIVITMMKSEKLFCSVRVVKSNRIQVRRRHTTLVKIASKTAYPW